MWICKQEDSMPRKNKHNRNDYPSKTTHGNTAMDGYVHHGGLRLRGKPNPEHEKKRAKDQLEEALKKYHHGN